MAYYHFLSARDYERALAELGFVEANAQETPEFFGTRSSIYEGMGDWERCLADSDRAVALDPRNVLLLTQQAARRIWLRRYDEAERLFERALDVAPDSAYPLYGKAYVALMRDGDYAELEEQRKLILSDQWPAGPGDWFGAWLERDYDAALELIDHNEIPDAWGPSLVRGMTQQMAGREDLARSQFQLVREAVQKELDALPSAGRRRPELLAVLGLVFAGLGETDAAWNATRDSLNDLHSAPAPIAANIRLAAVRVYAWTGELDLAFAELDDYLANPGDWSIEALRLNPQLDDIHDDPRFLSLVEKYRRR